jgi:hypothetical protein
VPRAVYTALFGGYEPLHEQPQALTSTVPFICFTDDPHLTSETWDVRVVEPALIADPVRSARIVKIRGHGQLADFDETLWIDNRIVLSVDPEVILDEWLAEAELALPWHSFRDTVAGEFEIVALTRLDDPARIWEQFSHYQRYYPEILAARPHWTAIIARKNTEAVAHAMRVWGDQVLRYSRRDQLSESIALASTELTVNSVTLDNLGSHLHEWPAATERHFSAYVGRLDAPVLSVEELKLGLDELMIDAAGAIEARDAEITMLQDEREAMRRSRSWRVTAMIRVVSDLRAKVARRIAQ